jgi:hypothetical protein
LGDDFFDALNRDDPDAGAFDKSSCHRPSNPLTGWTRVPMLHNHAALEFTLGRD